jgi:hypothetical protein
LSLASADGDTALPPRPLGQLTLIATDRSFEIPDISITQHATFSDQIELLGYDTNLTNARPGGLIQLTLYWRALAEMDTSYTVFTHVLDPVGQSVAQQDNPPVNGTYPTTLWLPGEVITDKYDISLPIDLPPGDYPIEIGLYIAENGLRLADAVLLNTIVTVSP